MFSEFKVNGQTVTNPVDAQRLKINVAYEENSIADVQPVVNFDKLVFVRDGVSAIQKARKDLGIYHQVSIDFNLNDRDIFNGYLTDFNFLLERDEIEAKPVSLNSSSGLTELLSALSFSSIQDKLTYQNIEYIIEDVDPTDKLVQLGASQLFYSYILYKQIEDIADFQAEAVRTAGNTPFNIGDIIYLVLKGIALIAFLAITVIAIIKQAKEMKELLFPSKKRTKVVSLHELLTVALSEIGYSLVTDIDDMSNVYHWASGKIDNEEYYPRVNDRCGSALGVLSLVLEKYAARVAVQDKTVYIYNEYSDNFFKNKPLQIQSFPDNNYRENVNDMVGTREIIYSTDAIDDWTDEEFKGTEYIIRANINDPTKSTVLGLDQTNYGVALCSRKSNLNILEKTWSGFVGIINTVIDVFGGSNQALSSPNRLGVARVSSNRLGVAKLVYLQGGKIPSNHRDKLSARADEENFHFVKSHVRNPKRKTRIYEQVLQRYNEDSLSCSLNGNACLSPEGISGRVNRVNWNYEYDNAVLEFEIEDVNRETRLIETFYEPE